MRNNNLHILCTRPLETSLVAMAKKQGIIIDELSFIETTPIETIDTKQAIKAAVAKKSTVVFTSMNAVEVVADYAAKAPTDWRIYCIGTTTNELVKKHFGASAIAGTANSAAELATSIIKDKSTDQVTFFCGDQRRNELPQMLHDSNIVVNEIMVYKTIAVAHPIDKVYDGILFFSPSAVDSFFSNNHLPATTLLFAIGATTANQIKTFSANKIVVSDVPGKENLVKKMMEYFSTTTSLNQE